MKHAMLILNLCIAALLSTAPPARAAPRDISSEIAALRPAIASARLYHFPDGFSTNHTLHEEDIAKGCYYAATGDDLATLLDLLVSADMKQYQPSPYGFEAHIALYLRTRDGTSIPLVFSVAFTNAPVQGMYDRTVPIQANNMDFGPALHDWIARHTQTDDSTPEKCTTFLISASPLSQGASS